MIILVENVEQYPNFPQLSKSVFILIMTKKEYQENAVSLISSFLLLKHPLNFQYHCNKILDIFPSIKS